MLDDNGSTLRGMEIAHLPVNNRGSALQACAATRLASPAKNKTVATGSANSPDRIDTRPGLKLETSSR
jgi:hypothetical protein